MDELTDDFKNSIFLNIGSITEEYAELGIDSFINDGVLKEIPIVKSIVSVLKIGKNLYDRNLLKQTLTFISEFNDNTIEKEKLSRYRKLIENDSKKAEGELGRILLLLNRYIDKEKSIMLSKIFKAYVSERINWTDFCEFSEIINRIFIQDLNVLRMIYFGTISDTSNRNDMFRVERLNSLGVIGLSMKSISVFGQNQARQDSYLTISNNGRKFMDIIMN